ncbi:MAG: hypothetical protein LAO03_23110 [Acidobacteriia bacterium]|nr:hypothetical protein [Terriglobia bacterium]
MPAFYISFGKSLVKPSTPSVCFMPRGVEMHSIVDVNKRLHSKSHQGLSAHTAVNERYGDVTPTDLDNFRVADYSGVGAIFTNTSAFIDTNPTTVVTVISLLAI